MIDTQYPHTVKVTTTAPSLKDANDNYQPGVPTASVGSGRWEVAKASAFITGSDGKQVAYSGIIYLRKGAERFALGAKVEVYDDLSNLIANGEVKQFDQGSFNRRIWI